MNPAPKFSRPKTKQCDGFDEVKDGYTRRWVAGRYVAYNGHAVGCRCEECGRAEEAWSKAGRREARLL